MNQEPLKWSSEDERPVPEPGYLRKVLEDLWESLFAVVVWTLLLWLLSLLAIFFAFSFVPLGMAIAALTVVPAFAGMMVMSGKLAKGGFARLGDAVRGTFHLYWRSVTLIAPMILVLLMILVTADVVRSLPGRIEMMVAWSFQIGIALSMVVLHIYLYPIMALYDTSLKLTIGLAMMLVSKFMLQTLALLTVGAALLVLAQFIPLVWLAVPGVWCVIVMNATWRLSRQAMPGLSKIDK